MNSEQAKKLDLPEIMARFGYHPVKEAKGGIELWYKSPFRNEADPSFHTSYLGGKWIWNDFGDSGGTVIDFIMRHENYSSVKDALAFLRDLYGRVGERIVSNGQRSFSFQQQAKPAVAGQNFRELELVSVKDVTSNIIRTYLVEDRGIAAGLISRYLKEIRYKNLNTGKEYFAFGTENVAGGFEIRVASDDYSFKSAIGKRDVTFFPGAKPQLKIIDVFEGTTDFLALLTMMRTDTLNGDVLIMNSLSSFKSALTFIQERDYKSVNLFLDNDRPGHETTAAFIKELGSEIVTNQAKMFLPYVDLGDALKPERATKKAYVDSEQ